MQFAGSGAGFSKGARHIAEALSQWFPAPEILEPRSVGVDISDASIKWIAFSPGKPGSRRVLSWGHEALEQRIVASGVVYDIPALARALAQMKKQLPHIHCAHAALPEEAAFVFNMKVPSDSSRAQILNMIEFELETRVPIAPAEAVFDFNRIEAAQGTPEMEIGVVVFPRELAQSYAAAFDAAGITLLSLELEARSIARAVSDPSDESIALLVDFGGTRTGFAVIKQGIPIFTSTVDVGGDSITSALEKKLGLTPEEVDTWKNEQGLTPEGETRSAALEAISGITSALGDEVARHYRYWDTRRDDRGARVTPVARVLLVGGSANLKGLVDYISGRVQAAAERPDVWQNVCTFDEYIPPIDRHTSLEYSTAIGLALRSA